MHFIAPFRPQHRVMYSWNTRHNNWRYIVWDMDKILNHDWHHKEQVEKALKRKDENMVAFLIRYQILYGLGGIIVPNWVINLKCINPLMEIQEQDDVLMDISRSFIASSRHNPHIKAILDKVGTYSKIQEAIALEDEFWSGKSTLLNMHEYYTHQSETQVPFVNYILKSEKMNYAKL